MLLWVCVAVLGLIGLFVAFELFGRVLNRVGWRISFDQVHDYVGAIMRSGEHGDRLLLRSLGHRVEFIKLIPRGGPTRFVLSLDKHFGTSADLAAAKAWLHAQGIDCQEETSGEGHHGEQRLTVEIGQDVALGTRLALGLFKEVLRVPQDAGVRFGHIARMVVRPGVVVGWKD